MLNELPLSRIVSRDEIGLLEEATIFSSPCNTRIILPILQRSLSYLGGRIAICGRDTFVPIQCMDPAISPLQFLGRWFCERLMLLGSQ